MILLHECPVFDGDLPLRPLAAAGIKFASADNLLLTLVKNFFLLLLLQVLRRSTFEIIRVHNLKRIVIKSRKNTTAIQHLFQKIEK